MSPVGVSLWSLHAVVGGQRPVGGGSDLLTAASRMINDSGPGAVYDAVAGPEMMINRVVGLRSCGGMVYLGSGRLADWFVRIAVVSCSCFVRSVETL